MKFWIVVGFLLAVIGSAVYTVFSALTGNLVSQDTTEAFSVALVLIILFVLAEVIDEARRDH